MAEVLIYGPIDWFSASEQIQQMEAAKDEDLKGRINSNGGDPEAGWSVVGKFKEHPGSKIIQVDGTAKSTAAFFLLYADRVEAWDTSTFLLHRAAFPEFIEEHHMSGAMELARDNVNKSLRTAFEAKIDLPKFEKISGITVDELFSTDGREEVVLTAKQAKQIGLVDKVNKMTPELAAEVNSKFDHMSTSLAAQYLVTAEVETETPTPPQKPKNIPEPKNNKMEIQQLRSDHPELYAQVLALGVTQEKDRIGAWIPFIPVDSEMVLEAIKDDKVIGQTELSEFAIKAQSPEYLEKLKAQAAKEVETETPAEGKDGEKAAQLKADTEVVMSFHQPVAKPVEKQA